jgi:hypothetical protein
MIKTFIDKLNKNEKSRDYLIRGYIDSYLIKRQNYPYLTSHQILADVWISFHKPFLKNISDKKKIALLETFNFSCLPEPANAKALALWLAYKDMPALIGLQNIYFLEIRRMLKPVYLAKKKGKIAELYNKYNPQYN